jgi:predicted N-acetyltransferase YhbS
MEIRKLTQSELEDVKNIDRSEIITHVYYFKKGELVLEEEQHDVPGWKPEVIAKHIEYLKDLTDRKGIICGAFDNSKLVGVMALENKFIGSNKDQLELYFMHVSNNYRGKGVGTELFKIAVKEAQKLGAVKLYISASPSRLTTDFYLNLGCKLAQELIPELFEREPEDIHLEYEL